MIAQELTDACGQDPSWLCRSVFELTNRVWLAAAVSAVLASLLIIIGAWILIRIVRRQLPRVTEAYVSARESEAERVDAGGLSEAQRIDQGLRLERARQRAETLGGVLASVLSGVIWFIAGLLVLDQAGVNLAPLLAGAGVVGIAIGFGAQEMVRDFLAGLFIVFEDQFGVGDVVDLGEASGTVEQVNLRVTRLRDVNGVVWYVPNGEIQRVGNKSKLWSRAVLDIEVAYDTDIDEAGRILKQVADELWRESLPDMSIIDEPEFWGVETFGADGITIRLVIRTEPTEQWKTARELRARIKKAFEEAGIGFPFPQRTVWIKSEN